MAAEKPRPVDPEKLARFREKWGAFGIPVTDEAMAFLARPKQRIVGRVYTDEQTMREDLQELQFEETER